MSFGQKCTSFVLLKEQTKLQSKFERLKLTFEKKWPHADLSLFNSIKNCLRYSSLLGMCF